MTFDHNQTFYDILDITPDASPQEIREAYLKSKAAFNKDSLALYTLISGDERELMLKKIEKAYETLSHPDLRRIYDQNHHQESALPSLGSSEVLSIDRTPPMEETPSDEALLVPPSTEISQHVKAPSSEIPARALPSSDTDLSSDTTANSHAHLTSWTGADLKKVRESKRLSIEEMSGITKISKTYIQAIEEENFSKLPAPVFVRGFVTQLAKALKLSSDLVAISYMTRYKNPK